MSEEEEVDKGIKDFLKDCERVEKERLRRKRPREEEYMRTKYQHLVYNHSDHYPSLRLLLSQCQERKKFLQINENNGAVKYSSPLHSAIWKPSCFNRLLEEPEIDVHLTNKRGRTAFEETMLLAPERTKEIVIDYIEKNDDENKTLLKRILNVQSNADGNALSCASSHKVIRFLLKEGIDPHLQDGDGFIPLSKQLVLKQVTQTKKLLDEIKAAIPLLCKATDFTKAYNLIRETSMYAPVDVVSFLYGWYKDKLKSILIVHCFSKKEEEKKVFLPREILRKLIEEFVERDYSW